MGRNQWFFSTNFLDCYHLPIILHLSIVLTEMFKIKLFKKSDETCMTMRLSILKKKIKINYCWIIRSGQISFLKKRKSGFHCWIFSYSSHNSISRSSAIFHFFLYLNFCVPREVKNTKFLIFIILCTRFPRRWKIQSLRDKLSCTLMKLLLLQNDENDFKFALKFNGIALSFITKTSWKD
jgi:hypothetical protein